MNNDLLDMINSIDELCNKVEKETSETKKLIRKVEKELIRNFHNDLLEYKKIMNKAGLDEFTCLTRFVGSTYGMPVYLVINSNSIGFYEPGRIERWAISDLSRENIIKWWYEDLDREAFDKGFQNAVVKAAKARVEKIIKENEDVKSIKIHARITMGLNLKDSTWKEIYERIKVKDPTVCGELFALFKQWGKVDDNYGDSYIPGCWLAYDMTGDENAEGFEDIELHSN